MFIRGRKKLGAEAGKNELNSNPCILFFSSTKYVDGCLIYSFFLFLPSIFFLPALDEHRSRHIQQNELSSRCDSRLKQLIVGFRPGFL